MSCDSGMQSDDKNLYVCTVDLYVCNVNLHVCILGTEVFTIDEWFYIIKL